MFVSNSYNNIASCIMGAVPIVIDLRGEARMLSTIVFMIAPLEDEGTA